jgi:hypothetical protein
VSVNDRTVLAPMASLELCTDCMSGLWGPISRVGFVTTISNHTSLLRVVLFTFGGRMRSRAKTSSWDQGHNFDIVGTFEWLSHVRAYGSEAYGVLVRFFPCRMYIDSSHRDTLGYKWQIVIAVIL